MTFCVVDQQKEDGFASENELFIVGAHTGAGWDIPGGTAAMR